MPAGVGVSDELIEGFLVQVQKKWALFLLWW